MLFKYLAHQDNLQLQMATAGILMLNQEAGWTFEPNLIKNTQLDKATLPQSKFICTQVRHWTTR